MKHMHCFMGNGQLMFAQHILLCRVSDVFYVLCTSDKTAIIIVITELNIDKYTYNGVCCNKGT